MILRISSYILKLKLSKKRLVFLASTTKTMKIPCGKFLPITYELDYITGMQLLALDKATHVHQHSTHNNGAIYSSVTR